jgi:hypothetical protein
MRATPCEWFALCTNTTDTYIEHPILGPVPCCARCAAQVGGTELLKKIPEDQS